ncbi:MAG: SAM-dependent methyltransferase [Fibrobacteres bacterium]|nr:SAM-dependent methyltransferase [Fibrobacterota bacterium]
MSGAAGFKDHFSGHSGGYARARPVYPESLFTWLAGLPRGREAAWDCGTGTGQAARSLASRFRKVIATDASANQVAKADRTANASEGGGMLLYAAALAERAPLRNGSVDLITVAQALHWFDFPAFFAEAARVAKPGAVFAAWCYGNSRITPEVDAVYARLYKDIVGPYWPPERAHVEDGYAGIPMPFAPIAGPAFAIEARWDMEEFIAYLDTWSAVQYYRKDKGADPIALVREEMARAWGNPAEQRLITWPLAVKAGRAG